MNDKSAMKRTIITLLGAAVLAPPSMLGQPAQLPHAPQVIVQGPLAHDQNQNLVQFDLEISELLDVCGGFVEVVEAIVGLGQTLLPG